MRPCELVQFDGCLSSSHSSRCRPEPGLLDPDDFIAPRNGFAMSYRDFIPHLMNVLDQLGMSLHARTNFIKCVSSALSLY